MLDLNCCVFHQIDLFTTVAESLSPQAVRNYLNLLKLGATKVHE